MNEHFSQINEDCLVLTPNRRLCSFFSHQYDQWKLNQQTKAWVGIKNMPFDQWLIELWQNNFKSSQQLLNSAQLSYLWQRMIENQSDNTELLRLDATAKHAIEAMRMLVLWDVPIIQRDFANNFDWKIFYSWYHTYKDYLKKNNLIDCHHSAKTLLDQLINYPKSFNLPHKLFLLGFDDIPPLWQNLLDVLKKSVEIKYIDFTKPQTQSVRFEFSTFNDELERMASWAKDQFHVNPEDKIACIIPSLTEKRNHIEKTFIKLFSMQKFMHLVDKDEFPFNISSGESLGIFQIIHSALSLLKLNETSHYSTKTIKFLLRCPFIIGYYKEFEKRALLEKKLLQFQSYNIQKKYFFSTLEHYCPILSMHLQRLLQLNCKGKQSLLSWVEFFNTQLEAISWPGERELSSQNFQLISRFKQCFNELLELDEFVGPCNKSTAIGLLSQIVTDTLFQVKTGEKPIQVLGSLEAAGQTFDKLWIMECNDTNWPPAANPNPFIPHSLQRKYQLPHSTAERELHFSTKLMQRLLKSATEVIVSYALQDNDQELKGSSLIKHLPLKTCHVEAFSPDEYIYKTSNLENYSDFKASIVQGDELTSIRGGTAIIAAQAACPFRAFATFRLKATSCPLPQPGLTALERGSIVHAALEKFWQQVNNLSQLVSLTESQLANIIHSCALAAITGVNSQLSHVQPKLFAMESKRVIKLLSHWLELEKKREDFTVLSTEQAIETTFANMPLSLRIDRIDQTKEGALILIDYKTGLVSTNRWFGERLDEPQLPLYALIFPDCVNGIVFGQIKMHEFSIKGIGDHKASGFGIQEVLNKGTGDKSQKNHSWEAQKSIWRDDITQLTQSFIQGDARVDPKNGAQTCAYCDLQSLCRVSELYD